MVMRRPRVRVWMLMMAVAAVAISIGGWRIIRVSRTSERLAREYAAREKSMRRYIPSELATIRYHEEELRRAKRDAKNNLARIHAYEETKTAEPALQERMSSHQARLETSLVA